MSTSLGDKIKDNFLYSCVGLYGHTQLPTYLHNFVLSTLRSGARRLWKRVYI